MNRRTRLMLGLSVALITAAALHFTVGSRFHNHGYRYYGDPGCKSGWGRGSSNGEQSKSAEPLQAPAQ